MLVFRIQTQKGQKKGFKRVHVPAGKKKVNDPIPIEELKYWNGEINKFQLENGKMQFSVVARSKDLRLSTEIIAK